MRYLLLLLVAIVVGTSSCHRNDGPTNEFKNAKVHASDIEQKSRKNADKRAIKQAHKNMRAARKAQRKKSRNWGKKGSYQ